MARNHRPVDGKQKKFWQQYGSNNKEVTTTASLFDPLGYLTSTTVKMRLFLQNLWIQEKGWGDQLKNEDIETGQKIIAEIKELSTTSVPRHIGGENPRFLCFYDALEKAYVTAI